MWGVCYVYSGGLEMPRRREGGGRKGEGEGGEGDGALGEGGLFE